MSVPSESMQRARTRIDPQEPSFDRLLDRRRRRRRNGRIASLAMALVVTGGAVAGAVVALGHTGPARHGGARFADGGPNLVAGPGQYYFTRTAIYCDEYAPGHSDLGAQGPGTVE